MEKEGPQSTGRRSKAQTETPEEWLQTAETWWRALPRLGLRERTSGLQKVERRFPANEQA
jgi:hypothetical protein